MNKYCNWPPSSILLGQVYADSNEIIVLFFVKKTATLLQDVGITVF